MSTILIQTIAAIAGLSALGIAFGLILSIAKKKLHVEKDPKIEAINEILPGANCGACGFPGCAGYAEEVVVNGVEVTLCPVGGADVAAKIGEIMGKETGSVEKRIARIHCQGGIDNTKNKFVYEGPQSCAGAQQIRGGYRVCSYGCLGLGDCEVVCPFGAITMGKDRLPIVDPEKCTGCGKCVEACPRMIISLTAASQEVYVKCRNQEKGAQMKQGCAVGCIGCKLCINKACKNVFADDPDVESAISVDNFLAKVDGNLCTNCGQCADVCPQKVITFPASSSLS